LHVSPFAFADSITHCFPIINPSGRGYMETMPAQITSRPTPWRTVVVVCRKCGKKLGGGFGRKGKESLLDVLRQVLRDAGRRRDVRICETSCLGLCPKHGVTAFNATIPGIIHVLPAGMDGAEVVQTLLGSHIIADGGGIKAT
jgi:hypothetical protein